MFFMYQHFCIFTDNVLKLKMDKIQIRVNTKLLSKQQFPKALKFSLTRWYYTFGHIACR